MEFDEDPIIAISEFFTDISRTIPANIYELQENNHRDTRFETKTRSYKSNLMNKDTYLTLTWDTKEEFLY